MTTFAQLRNSLQSFLTHHLSDLEIEERIEALTWYCQGLGLEIPHKTALGIAARLQPDNIQACRQRMQRALHRGRFSHDEVFQRTQQTVFAAELMEAYCIDDTGFAKDGTASAAVQRQYSGTLGKVGNCQIAVTLHAASETFGTCLAAQLYLPSIWAEDRDRCLRAGIPENVECLPKWKIALNMLESALSNGGPRLPVTADAAYGDSRDLREGIRNAGCHYVVAISSNTNVWKPGVEPSVPPRTGTRGPCPKVARGPNNIKPVRVDKLAAELWDAGNFRKSSTCPTSASA
jgi:SRSO17 transposase